MRLKLRQGASALSVYDANGQSDGFWRPTCDVVAGTARIAFRTARVRTQECSLYVAGTT
jgi:hypothetical protein